MGHWRFRPYGDVSSNPAIVAERRIAATTEIRHPSIGPRAYYVDIYIFTDYFGRPYIEYKIYEVGRPYTARFPSTRLRGVLRKSTIPPGRYGALPLNLL